MDRDSETILLSGIPRSGTTLCCHLLNRFENTIALHEPIDPGSFSRDKLEAIEIVRSFVFDTRAQILSVGSAPSKQRDGHIPDNPVARVDGNRIETVSVGKVSFNKPLTENFRMVVKHNALFTALGEELRAHFRLFALVRNPLSILASWRSVELPVGEGRLPMGERFSSELSRALSSEGDLLNRQLMILTWFFDSYRKLQPELLLTYEELVETDAEILSRVTPYPMSESIAVDAQLKNSGCSQKEIEHLSSVLLTRPEIYEGFYSEGDIEVAKMEMIS